MISRRVWRAGQGCLQGLLYCSQVFRCPAEHTEVKRTPKVKLQPSVWMFGRSTNEDNCGLPLEGLGDRVYHAIFPALEVGGIYALSYDRWDLIFDVHIGYIAVHRSSLAPREAIA
ncbi:uncharacterized protein UTRI_05466 [Ustilago trichophora]|uniref:Uncharacterized protein n=1 Tax=Ustilago trichophora TaxID=86804 RepID=A0A5C3EG39_9BASI|nr:uncharacterized protein UTRI_05466 [Ustilago trichophora]